MKISAWHKAQGDAVEWWFGDLIYYDIVYKSKIFSDDYSKDTCDPINCGRVIKGGTGYAITNVNGIERFDKSKDRELPAEAERMFPDYSIYPEYDFAVSMTSRGCPNNCEFCHVSQKEGRCSVKVADVTDYWNGQKKIVVLDPNITACRDKENLLRQYAQTKAEIDYCQGLDIRFLTDADIEIINQTKISKIHFAWDNPNVDLSDKFKAYSRKAKHKPQGSFGMVYCLTNFEQGLTVEEHIERALFRIYCLRDLGFDPYVMIYNKPKADKRIKDLQRWCNNKWIFKSVSKFEDYNMI